MLRDLEHKIARRTSGVAHATRKAIDTEIHQELRGLRIERRYATQLVHALGQTAGTVADVTGKVTVSVETAAFIAFTRDPELAIGLLAVAEAVGLVHIEAEGVELLAHPSQRNAYSVFVDVALATLAGIPGGRAGASEQAGEQFKRNIELLIYLADLAALGSEGLTPPRKQ